MQLYNFPVKVRQIVAESQTTYAPTYGPQLCEVCCGAGYVRYDVPFGDPNFGKLQACSQCDRQSYGVLARCWDVGALNPNTTTYPTLTSFVPHDKDAKTMLSAAIAFATNPTGWLTIHGNGQGKAGKMVRNAGHYGAGKTHLGVGIARALLKRRIPALYVYAPEFYEYLGAVYPLRDDVDYDRRMQWALDVPVLILDEVNKERDTEGTWQRRQRLLMTRYTRAIGGQGGATVLLSNDNPDVWADQAIASRARDERFTCLLATPVDYRRIVAGGAA